MTDLTFLHIVTLLGTAGALGAFILLLYPAKRNWAIIAAVLVIVVGLGILAAVESAL